MSSSRGKKFPACVSDVLRAGIYRISWLAVWPEREIRMKKYTCTVCGWVYDEAAGDPDNGIAPGTKWEDLPADWVCPLCGAGKDEFTAK